MCLFLCGCFDTDIKRAVEANNSDNTAQQEEFRHMIMTNNISNYIPIFNGEKRSGRVGLLRVSVQQLRT
ncbi:hypothetical protein EAJ18_11760 [Citrobacter amalonaticus]|uniref:Uncharacterized protein n=1 Tax=Citrobacter amalonaticus TaxID=35703 RepID=A0ABY0HUR6_CITAM|nr:hypothetical protein EAJ18_11760 [Citrobacter amalonaticus]